MEVHLKSTLSVQEHTGLWLAAPSKKLAPSQEGSWESGLPHSSPGLSKCNSLRPINEKGPGSPQPLPLISGCPTFTPQ